MAIQTTKKKAPYLSKQGAKGENVMPYIATLVAQRCMKPVNTPASSGIGKWPYNSVFFCVDC